MRFTWEEKDIKAGRRLSQAHEEGEQFILGYDARVPDSNKQYALISLGDGSICLQGQTKEQLAEVLNRGEYRPLSL